MYCYKIRSMKCFYIFISGSNALGESLTQKQPQEVFYKKRCSQKFRKIHQSLFFNKVAGLRLATLLKKKLWHRSVPVSFTKFLRTPFLQNSSGRLLLSTLQNSRKLQLKVFLSITGLNIFENFNKKLLLLQVAVFNKICSATNILLDILWSAQKK